MKPILYPILIIAIAALCIGCGSAQSAATAAPEPDSPEAPGGEGLKRTAGQQSGKRGSGNDAHEDRRDRC